MKNIKLVFLFIYFLQLALYSQELYTPVTDTQGWINFGSGGCFINYNYGMSGLISFTYAHKGKLVSSRFTYSQTMFIDLTASPKNKHKEVKEFSIMYGFLSKQKFAFMSMAVGVGYINLNEKNISQINTFREIGISIETQTFLTLPGLGLGIYSFINFNRRVLYPGIIIAIQVGKLR